MECQRRAKTNLAFHTREVLAVGSLGTREHIGDYVGMYEHKKDVLFLEYSHKHLRFQVDDSCR